MIVRQNEDLTLTNISADLGAVVNGEQDLPLMNNDLVSVQSIFDLREEYTVSIQGAVQSPGKYPMPPIKRSRI